MLKDKIQPLNTMKVFFSAIIGLALGISAHAQENITVCHTPATERFSLFASNQNFNADHREPLPYAHQSEMGKMITFGTPDGKKGNAYFLEAKVRADEYLFVIHEWWGLNDYIKKESEKWYNEFDGIVNVVAIDLYDGKVATTRGEASKYMGKVKTDRAQAIIEGALDMAGPNGEIATIGWCFGGGWSLQTALLAGDNARACVMYYGMPEKDVNKLKNLDAPVLGVFASQDDWISPKVVDHFKTDMAKAGKKLRVESYNAAHAFANPSNPDYNKKAAEDAHEKAVAFIKSNL